MIDDLRPYAEMKPSGLPWLGDVPAHWDVKRSKYIFREADKRSTTGEETHLSMSQRHGLVPAGQITRSLVSESYVGGKLVERNDLVLNRLKAHLGVFAYAKQPGLISPDYTVLRPQDGAEVRYFEAALKSPACRGELFTRAKGIVEGFWRLYTDDFYNIRMPVPPIEEQRLIVRFLDWHGGQVARLVRAKKALIGLLNEQKQAIIHRAVTRGLDPNAKLKPSGISWLGDVPEGWIVQSLGSMIKRRSARNRTDLPLLSVARERGVILRSSMSDEENHNFVPDDLSNYKVAMRGDLVINKMKAWQGSLGIAPCDGIVSPAYFVYELDIENIEFGQMLLRSKPYVACFARVSDGVRIGQWDLSINGMKRIPVVRPTPHEQAAIVEYIGSATSDLERSKSLVQREIALIQEFRARVTADVVTGKVDVRALAATLPETAGQDLTFDLAEDEDLDDLPEDADTEEAAA